MPQTRQGSLGALTPIGPPYVCRGIHSCNTHTTTSVLLTFTSMPFDTHNAPSTSSCCCRAWRQRASSIRSLAYDSSCSSLEPRSSPVAGNCAFKHCSKYRPNNRGQKGHPCQPIPLPIEPTLATSASQLTVMFVLDEHGSQQGDDNAY